MTEADRADRYALYESAAQDPDRMARFLHAVHGGDPLVLGEDFAGTAAVARAWNRLDDRHSAVAVDHDAEPLKRAVGDRLSTRCCDVMEARDEADVIAVLNFSIGELHTRTDLIRYLRLAQMRLAPQSGVFVADLFGGESTLAGGEFEMQLDDDVTYCWRNNALDLINNHITSSMSFLFSDNSVLLNEFRYNWRLWSPREFADALLEVGFTGVTVYDRMGSALDDAGRLVVCPVSAMYAEAVELEADVDDGPAEESGPLDWVCYVAART